MKRYLIIVFIIFLTLQCSTRGLAQTSLLSSATSTVQSLVDRARVGDTIRIEPGLYEGDVVIAKRISLIGIGMPVLRGEGKGSCLTVVADSCVVRGFVIEHSGGMLVNEDAGILLKSKHNTIWGNELRDILFGIYLFKADSNLVAHNRIIGRRELELGERGSGIHVWNSHANKLVGNTISHARDGFYIQNANRTHVEGNDVFDLRYGLHYMYADSNVFLGNRFHDNVAGAAVMYSTGIVMRRNTFVHNRGFASYGILFQDCHQMRADSNIIADNVVGMFFEASTDNLFRHNIIARNDLALQMFQNSIHNTFAENNFIDNLSPLTIVGKRTESRWSKDGRGNYWSSYDGYDIDADGLGDVPMKIENVFTFLEGNYPNLRLYLYSPASQALAVAAKAFPILAVSEERDENPLMRPADLSVLVADGSSRSTTRGSMVTRSRTSWWFGVPVVAIGMLGIFYVLRLKRGGQ
jgi:nitrous oxidase accessory protein